jgi:hypothetical protein
VADQRIRFDPGLSAPLDSDTGAAGLMRAYRSRLDGHRSARRIWACSGCGEWAHAPVAAHPCKEHAKIHFFQSMAEFRRWLDLCIMQKAGQISDLRVHPSYPLHAAGPDGLPIEVCRYVADFAYDANGVPVIEDVKGSAKRAALDPVWRLKARWMAAQYGIEIRIVA